MPKYEYARNSDGKVAYTSDRESAKRIARENLAANYKASQERYEGRSISMRKAEDWAREHARQSDRRKSEDRK